MTSLRLIRSWPFHRSSKRSKKPVPHIQRRGVLEPLEPRLLFTAGPNVPVNDATEAHVLFAPGTPPDYMTQMERAVHHGSEFAETTPITHSDGQDVASDVDAYQADQRWSETSVDGDGLAWGDATALTWSIVPDGTPIAGFVGESDGASNFIEFMGRIYGTTVGSVTQQPWFDTVKSVFDRWGEISGLDFLYEPHDDGAAFSSYASRAPGVDGVRGDIRIGGHAIDGTSGTLAYNFFPNNGEMVLDTSDRFYLDTSHDSLRLRNVMAHELGHGIGLSHVIPADGTKLMEPVASTAFDGPQHDDILAAHRLYGDAWESRSGRDDFDNAIDVGTLTGRSVTIGSHQAEHYLSIDGEADVDYFRFTAAAGAQLDARLVPLGSTYQQGAVDGRIDAFASRAQNNLGIKVYDGDQRVLGQAHDRKAGESESLKPIDLAEQGEYYIEVSGAQDAAQFYQLELTVTPGSPRPMVDFHQRPVRGYGGRQDHAGTVTTSRDGHALRLVGNRWIMIEFPYVVTPDTVLEFDFASSREGDIHGIGFDSNTSISSGLTFRLFGTQDWGRGDFANYDPQTGRHHYVIPVGEFYTGKANALVFVNDHDVSRPNAQSVFSNVQVYERKHAAVAPPRATSDHIAVQQDSPTVAIDALANDAGESLAITSLGGGSAGGYVSLGRDGRIYYRPVAHFSGVETFTYTVSNAGGSSTTTVTATVLPRSTSLEARDNRYLLVGGYSYPLNVLNNDTVNTEAGAKLRIADVSSASHGAAVSSDGQQVTYRPADGFTGTETFRSTILDDMTGHRATARGTVHVRSAAEALLAIQPAQRDNDLSTSLSGAPLWALQYRFGHHSLDRQVTAALDNLFAALAHGDGASPDWC